MSHHRCIIEEKTVGTLRAIVEAMEDSSDFSPRDWDNLTVIAFVGSLSHLTDRGVDSIADDTYGTGYTADCPTCDGSGDADTYEVRLTGSGLLAQGFETEEEADHWCESLVMEHGWRVVASDCRDCEGSGDVEVSIAEYVKRSDSDVLAALPIRYEDHGSNGCRVYVCDDEDGNGVAYVTKASLAVTGAPMGEYGVTLDLEKGIHQDVAVYGEWLSGNVYEWCVEDEDGEVLESVCGYIGDDSIADAMAEAVSMAISIIARQTAEADAVAYWQQRGVETV